jgi:hypothetical protein
MLLIPLEDSLLKIDLMGTFFNAVTQIGGARIVLVDCDDSIRAERLHLDRAQPDLANCNMMNWARYLREEAHTADINVLDTGQLPITRCVELIIEWLANPHSIS